jgi:hypothetical protein
MVAITNSSFIKKTADCIEAVIDDELALMHTESGKFYSLSDTSRRIWELIGDGLNFGDLATVLLRQYQVSKDVCDNDLVELLEKLQERTLVEIS